MGDYFIWECAELETVLTYVLHEIPYMITQTFDCEIIVGIDLWFLPLYTEMEFEFYAAKSHDPVLCTSLELNYILCDITPDIETLFVVLPAPTFFHFITLSDDMEIFLPGCILLSDILSYLITEPLMHNFLRHYRSYPFRIRHRAPPKLYNELFTEEEFRLLISKNKAPFTKKIFRKIWNFLTINT